MFLVLLGSLERKSSLQLECHGDFQTETYFLILQGFPIHQVMKHTVYNLDTHDPGSRSWHDLPSGPDLVSRDLKA
jgi:hypothetical protein